jgi:UDP-N-acetylmuramoylalanine--D-glutamate ligase
VELSSWQCELLRDHRAAPDVAVVTNVTPDHLNRYPSFAAYASAKANLLRWQSPRASFVALNREDAVVRRFGPLVCGHRAWFASRPFASEDGAFMAQGWFTVRSQGRLHRIAPRSALVLPGVHMTANALAALAAVWWISPNRKRIRQALARFRGLPGRQEVTAHRRGVLYVNDTTATSPAGTLAALGVYRARKPVLIAGGVDKGLEFSALARAAASSCTAVVLLPGSATDRLQRLLPPRLTTVAVPSMSVAVRTASQLVHPGSVVLLSPGAASFNLFRHEYARGDAFTAAVRRLP